MCDNDELKISRTNCEKTENQKFQKSKVVLCDLH